jgi:hypothetical protein
MRFKTPILAALLSGFAFSAFAASNVAMTTFNSGSGGLNVLPGSAGTFSYPSAFSSYPALSASDAFCARYLGSGLTLQTPVTLGVSCGLSPLKMINEAYLARLFVEFVDAHRYLSSCPSWLQVTYDGAGFDPNCKF